MNQNRSYSYFPQLPSEGKAAMRVSTHTVAIAAAMICCCWAQANAQSAPAPKASPTADPPPPIKVETGFTYNGTLRGYYFTRTNEEQNSSNLDRAAFNPAVRLHGEYHFHNSPFIVGATYFGADPMGANGTNPGFKSNVDNTVPGFSLSTLGEAYLQYKTTRVEAKAGDQLLQTPWAPPSDTRVKPALYRGLETQWNLSERWSVGAARVIDFESRTSSNFFPVTLITSSQPGNPTYPLHDTSGFLMFDAGYKLNSRFAASAYDYEFYNIASLRWIEGKYSLAPSSDLKPYIATHYLNERQAGAAYVGTINNNTFGAQLGATLAPNVDAAFGIDTSPWRTATISAKSCSKVTAYWLPSGGTSNCVVNGSTATVYYGGIASPYTDSYTSDPLFTTSISQGMVERHSAGSAFRGTITLQPGERRFKLLIGCALYNYGNALGANITKELDLDGTIYFNPVTGGPYHGLSLRHRYADRTQPTIPLDFKYNRTMLQYDF